MKDRYLKQQVLSDLEKKMVFIGGPRQVGKTTLARSIRGATKGYLNWDVTSDRSRILSQELPVSSIWVFDELHKYRQWRNYLKGIYDSRSQNQKILVTGSARLDLYRFGGESLQGRYHYLRLHPLTVAELGIEKRDDFLQLLKLGGFPEPFLGGSEKAANRWSREYRSRVLTEDVVALEQVRDVGTMELMMMRMSELVGSPLSINALREDLSRDHKTIAKWCDVFERVYAIFRLPPFGAPRLRAVKKEQKHYHFDWNSVKSEGYRFENLVASHLLKWVHFLQDTEGSDYELRYFRDTDKREVDFVVVDGKKPVLFVECKWGDDAVSPALRYLKAKFPDCPAWQISAVGTKDYLTPDGIRVAPALQLLRDLK